MGAWNVDRLVRLPAGLPAEEVALGDLPEIGSGYWFGELERPTVGKVTGYFRRVAEADLSYPVILGPGNRVMDGMHRVARALPEGRTTVRARRCRELPEPGCRGCRPGALPC